jgi:hypothetical protein
MAFMTIVDHTPSGWSGSIRSDAPVTMLASGP